MREINYTKALWEALHDAMIKDERVFLVGGVGVYSNFVFAGILGSKSSQTLPVIAAATKGKYSSEWGQLAAITIIITVPIVVFTLFTQLH